ncbi:secreted protein [Christiangramia forsetii KT0803]|uniref:Secreted protein n=1 Tax=Christiangramia forsetii (strain DSM 17595 / CGMCC 1.15422 / KT0803) TaxID=411154 RepID=A0M4Q6_CHRFK|nr:hypothetical protein [Christiangramia forsetii]CAL67601.1 secreted protein [Christiangramia forsetii KT0803]
MKAIKLITATFIVALFSIGALTAQTNESEILATTEITVHD